jgi:hypothetical protein
VKRSSDKQEQKNRFPQEIIVKQQMIASRHLRWLKYLKNLF